MSCVRTVFGAVATASMALSLVLLSPQKSAHAQEQASAPKKFSVEMSLDNQVVKAGTPVDFLITLKPADGYVIKKETPFKAKLAPSDGLQLGKNKFSKKDFKDPEAPIKQISTAVTADKAGKHQIRAALTFFVCNDTLCERFKETAVFEFNAK